MDALSKVKTNLEDSKKEWQIHIDQTKAEQLGLTPELATTTSSIPYEEIAYW